MSHTKGLAEVKELPCSKSGTMKFLLVSGTGIAVMCGKVGGAKVEEGNAHRIAALWNMAERLGLSTEEIATKESLFRAAADMVKVLEWYGWKVDECRKNTLEGDRARYNLDRDGGSRAYAAIKKARGEE